MCLMRLNMDVGCWCQVRDLQAMRIPHPALRATFSRGEKDNLQGYPSPTGRGWREAPGEGSGGDENLFVPSHFPPLCATAFSARSTILCSASSTAIRFALRSISWRRGISDSSERIVDA